jgi:hypothetical protein
MFLQRFSYIGVKCQVATEVVVVPLHVVSLMEVVNDVSLKGAESLPEERPSFVWGMGVEEGSWKKRKCLIVNMLKKY